VSAEFQLVPALLIVGLTVVPFFTTALTLAINVAMLNQMAAHRLVPAASPVTITGVQLHGAVTAHNAGSMDSKFGIMPAGASS
jgi:hypothetical protein